MNIPAAENVLGTLGAVGSPARPIQSLPLMTFIGVLVNPGWPSFYVNIYSIVLIFSSFYPRLSSITGDMIPKVYKGQ